MDLGAVLHNVSFGPDPSGNFKLSVDGELAVRTSAEGAFVDKRGREVLTVDGSESFVYRVPVKKVSPGDLIITRENPLQALFVEEVVGGGAADKGEARAQQVTVKAFNPFAGLRGEYVLPTNLFALPLFVRVVNLLGALRGGEGKGEDLLPLLLAGRGQAGGDPLSTLLMMRMFREGGGKEGAGSLLPLLLLGGQSKSDLPSTLLLAGALGGGEAFDNLLGGSGSGRPAPSGKGGSATTT